MDDTNELNDIILNKSSNKSGRQKLLVSIATFSMILIIVVLVMNQMNGSGTQNLPKPEKMTQPLQNNDNSLFEPVEVVEENAKNDPFNLDDVVQKIKQQEAETAADNAVDKEIIIVQERELKPVKNNPKKQPATTKPSTKKHSVQTTQPQKLAVKIGATYIQVGSFSKYAPNRSFIDKITRSGYDYTYHRVVQQGKIVNKVLVGPFKNRAEAKNALMSVRKLIESNAFIITSLK